VYVYAEQGQPHHLPPCNVRWPDSNAQVSLPELELLAGTPLPREAVTLLLEHLDALMATWDRLNPGRSV
jgi:hypothetical protein